MPEGFAFGSQPPLLVVNLVPVVLLLAVLVVLVLVVLVLVTVLVVVSMARYPKIIFLDSLHKDII